MVANLYGDFVKGSDLSSYTPLIQKGITLHRSIDQYIDHHPTVVELMHLLYPELPKVTGIAIDIFFDHLLAKNWNKFSEVTYSEFLENFYSYIPSNDSYTADFIFFLHQMKSVKWLNYYPFNEGLKKACQGVSTKLSFENKLTIADQVFHKYSQEIEKCFMEFMEDAIPYFNLKFKELGLH